MKISKVFLMFSLRREEEKDSTSRLCSDLSDLRIERIGSTPAFQWISVYNKRPPMKQRFE